MEPGYTAVPWGDCDCDFDCDWRAVDGGYDEENSTDCRDIRSIHSTHSILLILRKGKRMGMGMGKRKEKDKGVALKWDSNSNTTVTTYSSGGGTEAPSSRASFGRLFLNRMSGGTFVAPGSLTAAQGKRYNTDTILTWGLTLMYKVQDTKY